MQAGERDGEAWRALRYEHVTGTDVARILGMDPYVSRRRLLESKLAHADPSDSAGPYAQRLMAMGRESEPAARDAFVALAETYGPAEFRVPGFVEHRTYTWLAGTPDLLVIEHGKPAGVVEIKCHFHPDPALADPIACEADFPLRHWLQVQTYLEILNVDNGFLWSWTRCQGATLFHVQRADPALFEHCVLPLLYEFKDILRKYYRAEGPTTAPKEDLAKLVFRRGEKDDIRAVLQHHLDVTTTYLCRSRE